MRAHLAGADDALVMVRPILDRVGNFNELLQPDGGRSSDQDFRGLRDAEGTGRQLGPADFVAGLEAMLGRKIARRAPGGKPAGSAALSNQLELL